jgi:hypothetical protein
LERNKDSSAGCLKIKPQIYDGKDDFDEYLAQFQIMAIPFLKSEFNKYICFENMFSI